jgi:hypothetical protein
LELILDPVLEDELPTMDPCDELKNLIRTDDQVIINFGDTTVIKSPKLKQKLIESRSDVNHKFECGNELRYDPLTKTFTANEVQDGTSKNNTILLTLGGIYYGGIHTHPINGYPIPSFGDLVWLKNCYKEAARFNRNRVVALIVVKNPNSSVPETLTYALKIDNFVQFESSINSLLNAATPFPLLTPEQQEYKRTEIITAAEDKYYGTNYSALEKLFLQKYGSLGLNLSRANDALTNFDKLSLDINNNVIENPCN